MVKRGKLSRLKHDRFYRLAKETGYRSRAAFKLIQLNRKYGFLNDARVVVDLCAAPGGWLQVAASILPVSSIIVGVDLVPIKPIDNVLTIVGDITTDSCLKKIKSELQNWKADIILHDGAPNLGQSWISDAFGQTQLTLSAIKLMVEILKTNGWFVTKIFRSKDYLNLTKVLSSLFKTVHTSKPIASRQESAEIFLVCQEFVGLKNFDRSILLFNNVFKEDHSTKPPLTLKKLINPRHSNREGYADDAPPLIYRQVVASEFLASRNPLELLSSANEIVFDDPKFDSDKLVPQDIREYCKDVRILGLTEIKSLLSWRKKMLKNTQTAKDSITHVPITDEETEEQELQRVSKDELRELRKSAKKRKKLERITQAKLQKTLEQTSESPLNPEDPELFSLSSIKTKTQMEKIYKNNDCLDDELNKIPPSNTVCGVLPKKPLKSILKSPFVVDDAMIQSAHGGIQIDDAVEADVDFLLKKKVKKRKSESKKEVKIDDLPGYKSEPRIELTPEELALGQYIRESPKNKKELIELSWNRNIRDPKEELPLFFKEYEDKHRIKTLPITKEQVEFYRKKQFDLNAQPIKKVFEAKARKRRRQQKILEKAKNKAERLLSEESHLESDKLDQVKRLYKNAGKALNKKPKKKLIVSKKGLAFGRKYQKPKGVKGPSKLVDRRMKKDKRKHQTVKKHKKRQKRSKTRYRKRR